jgi:hypothetical protein
MNVSKPPDFDLAAAHEYFSAQCFNEAWELMEKPVRSEEENGLMVALNQASIYHWLQREDCNDQRLSVGYWQASRIQSQLGNTAEAIRLANICLTHSTHLKPFYLGYAHEALARAHGLARDSAQAIQHLAAAKELAARVSSKDERELLEGDVQQLAAAKD